MNRVAVIGAGVGGLTAAAVLAKAGLHVSVLEAHIYPGGTAGTFYHQGYRFDAGATLAGGFYTGGPMDLVAQAAGIGSWPAVPDDKAMVVHLPGQEPITRWSDERRWTERQGAFGDSGVEFFRWQEGIADAVWKLALLGLPWPPQRLEDLPVLVQQTAGWARQKDILSALPNLVQSAFSPMRNLLKGADDRLRLFVDAQLLISAQATSDHANALYGAAALDLPRRGIAHLKGGIGSIASRLAQAVHAHGGEVRYRSEVTRVEKLDGLFNIQLAQGDSLSADLVIFNLTPWNIRRLLNPTKLRRLQGLSSTPEDGWGAGMLYAGIDSSILPEDSALHHQVVQAEPLGDGNSVFVSVSPAWDRGRALVGKRAVTLSTHTRLARWWHWFESDRVEYERRKRQLSERMIQAAEVALPGFERSVELALPGTPVTFNRFTRRDWGWVGGFPQTNLFRSWGPRLTEGLWMVGDSIFPGQSTAAVALGGLRVAQTILNRNAPAAAWNPEDGKIQAERIGDEKVMTAFEMPTRTETFR